MFKELAPLLTERSLILTVTAGEGDQVHVTITPQLGKEDSKALSQPLSVSGTAEELDASLAENLVAYTAEIMTFDRSLKLVKSGMDASLAEVKAESDKRIAEAKKNGKSTTKPVTPAKQEVKKPEEPARPSLFDPPEPALTTDAPAVDAESDEESGEDEEEDGENNNQVSETVAPNEAVSSIASSPLFTQTEIEDEILQEVSSGTFDQSVAA
jgi:PRTRC genetic system protein E